jgi:hypothetical protein
VWTVRYLPEAEQELLALVPSEQDALARAAEKLAVQGPALRAPHGSAVMGGGKLRELRPRAGRSRWRALYRRVGDEFVIAAIAPEAQVDRRGFDAACDTAVMRLGREKTL